MILHNLKPSSYLMENLSNFVIRNPKSQASLLDLYFPLATQTQEIGYPLPPVLERIHHSRIQYYGIGKTRGWMGRTCLYYAIHIVRDKELAMNIFYDMVDCKFVVSRELIYELKDLVSNDKESSERIRKYINLYE